MCLLLAVNIGHVVHKVKYSNNYGENHKKKKEEKGPKNYFKRPLKWCAHLTSLNRKTNNVIYMVAEKKFAYLD